MKYLKSFIVGSSLPASFITFLYVSQANNKLDLSKRPLAFSTAPAVLFIYGIFNMIAMYFIEKDVNTSSKLLTMGLVGGALGIFLSSIGYAMGLPTKIFGFDEYSKYKIFIIAPILYAMIFLLIIHPMNDHLEVY